MKSAKVAISLPEQVLKAVEQGRRATGESRSEFFRRAIEKLLAQEAEAAKAREYILRYQEFPETALEVSETHMSARQALEQEPW